MSFAPLGEPSVTYQQRADVSRTHPRWERLLAIPLGLAARAVANFLTKRPYCASFELTYNCNARCGHCHRGVPVPNEKLATPERLLEICKEVRPVVAIMSGGEPLIRKELEEIVRLFKTEAGPIRIFVNTNGALLTPERFRNLKQAGVDEIFLPGTNTRSIVDYLDQRLKTAPPDG